MGMYTGLRGRIVLKSNVALAMTSYDRMYELADDVNDVHDILLKYKFNVWAYVQKATKMDLNEFVDDFRSAHITSSGVWYMPDDWEYQKIISVERHGYYHRHVLLFCCSLKNYTGTIAKFINILPLIAHSWYIEERYEEDQESTFHHSDVL